MVVSMQRFNDSDCQKIVSETKCYVSNTIESLTFLSTLIKGRFLLFQVYRNFANLFSKLSISTFYMVISKFQQKMQSEKN